MLLVREGLAVLLRDRGIDVVGEVGSTDGLVELVRLSAADAVVLDIRMPPTFTDEGLVAAARLRQEFPQLAVLVLSQFVDVAHALRLLHDTPERSGYLLKDRVIDIATVIDALRRLTRAKP